MLSRVTAVADKLGVDFAIIHRKKDGKSDKAPERMEILVGDVEGKVRWLHCSKCLSNSGATGCSSRR